MKHTIFEILSVLVEMEESEETERSISNILGSCHINDTSCWYSAVEMSCDSTKNQLIFFLSVEDHNNIDKIKRYDYKVIVTPGFSKPEIKVIGHKSKKEIIKVKFNEFGNQKIEVSRYESDQKKLNDKLLKVQFSKILDFDRVEIKNEYKRLVLSFLKENGLGKSLRGFSPVEIRKALGRGSEEQQRIVCNELENEGLIAHTGNTKGKRYIIKTLEEEAKRNLEKHLKDRSESYRLMYDIQKGYRDYVEKSITHEMREEIKKELKKEFENKIKSISL